jgi:hypothetical protein
VRLRILSAYQMKKILLFVAASVAYFFASPTQAIYYTASYTDNAHFSSQEAARAAQEANFEDPVRWQSHSPEWAQPRLTERYIGYWYAIPGGVRGYCDDGWSPTGEDWWTRCAEYDPCPDDHHIISHVWTLKTPDNLEEEWYDFPLFISDGQCEYQIDSADSKDCYTYESQKDLIFCEGNYYRTGVPAPASDGSDGSTPSNPSNPTPQPPQEPNPPPSPSDPTDTPTSSPQPPTTTITKTSQPPTTEQNGDGSETTTQGSEETSETPPHTEITTDPVTKETTITTDDGTVVTKKETTETTTNPDGSTSTTTTTEYSKSPTTKTTATVGAGGAVSSSSSTSGGQTGVTTSTTTTGTDGSSTTTTTHGDGETTSAGAEEAEQEAEEEEEQPEFTGPSGEGAQDFGTTNANFWSSIQGGPWGSAFNFGGNLANGACPALELELPWGDVSTTIHCEIWEAVSGAFDIVTMAIWSLLALVILFSA